MLTLIGVNRHEIFLHVPDGSHQPPGGRFLISALLMRLNMKQNQLRMSSVIVVIVAMFVGAIWALPVRATPVFFDFDSAPRSAPLPIDITVDDLTAHLSATGQGFSIQRADALGFTPVGFAGNCVYPSSVFAADLLVSFSLPVSDFSILYAPEEYACDSSARMRVTAYFGATQVGTSTMTAQAGTWPTATLAIASALPFDRVIVHYDAPPPTGGDWGPIFMVDNMTATVAPEPDATGLLLLIAVAWLQHRNLR